MHKIGLRGFRCCWSRSCLRRSKFKIADAIWRLKIWNPLGILEIGIQGFSRSIITCSCSLSFIGCHYYRLRCATMHAYIYIYIYLCFFRLGKVPVLTPISDRLLNNALSASSLPAYHRPYREPHVQYGRIDSNLCRRKMVTNHDLAIRLSKFQMVVKSSREA